MKLRDRAVDMMARVIRWGDAHVPIGVRSLLGLVAMAGGVLGFLPILGFWLLPVGLALIALDIPPLRRRLLAWLEQQRERRRRRELITSR
jgi:hypothetical protein